MIGLQMLKKREDWPDITRAIAILLVVYGHSTRGLESSGLLEFGSTVRFLDNLVYTIHMPVFFAISGYFFDRSFSRSHSQFWTARAKTILWPYIFWSFVQIAVQVAVAGSGAVNIGESSLTRVYSIGWAPVSPFWFLYALFFSFIISALASKVKLYLLAACAFLAIVCTNYLGGGVSNDISYGLFYFTIGRIVNGFEADIPKNGYFALRAFAVVLVFASIGYFLGLDPRLEPFGAIAAIVCVISLSKIVAQTPLRNAAVIIGRCSMGIFVMHIIILGGVRLVGVRFMGGNVTATILAGIVLGVAIPMTVQLVLNHLKMAKLFGLGVDISDFTSTKQPLRVRV
jgi:fucose 4-O-acetylase-like acetyltransferase